MTKIIYSLIIIMFVLYSSVSHASVAYASIISSPKDKEIMVDGMLEMTGVKKMIDDMIPGIMNQVFRSLTLGDDIELSEDDEKVLTIVNEVTSEFMSKEFTPIVIRFYRDIYIEMFTVDELQDMIDFYNTPTGKKIIELTPTIMTKGITQTQSHMVDMYPRLMKQIEIRLEAEGL